MTEIARVIEIWDPTSGELVPVTEPDRVAEAVLHLRELRQKVNDTLADATVALVEESARQGTKTLHLNGLTVTVSGGTETIWDVETLRSALEEQGCPQERIEALIRAEVTYKIDGRVARELAGANPGYALAIRLAKQTVEKARYVKVM